MTDPNDPNNPDNWEPETRSIDEVLAEIAENARKDQKK